ncbi:hypothetical protein ACVWXU_001789 [Streptomyces sp. TE33382]
MFQAVIGIDSPIIGAIPSGALAKSGYAAPLFIKSAVGILREDLYGVSLSLKEETRRTAH